MENVETLPHTLLDRGGVPTSPAVSLPARYKRMERSCLMCHQRKIRCDKRSPCSHCVKADLLCCYPGPERAGRRPHKTTIADVAARVARLERTITAISSSTVQADLIDKSSPDLTPPTGEVNMSETLTVGAPPDELLVQDGFSSRYINEALLSRVLEEVGPTPTYMNKLSLMYSWSGTRAPDGYGKRNC